jgi:penicillin-binding protein 2
MDVWSNHIKSFGLGSFLGYDLPTGRKGKIPSGDTYNRIYPNGRWGSTTTISNAIGQGEVLMTPIQLANMMATVANQGYYYTPHIIRKINQTKNIDPKFKEKHQTTIDKKYFKPVVQGLFDVFNYGTASSLRVKGIDICGKTGTAENFARIDGRRVQLKDHSIFVAFAPKDNPKIAIALLVENAGFGATIAGPIATLMIEKYLNKKISRPDLEKRIINTSLKAQYDRLLGSSKKTATATDSLIAKNNLVKAVKKDTTKVN